eukprot:jgi/Ulvmu1/2655/UM014_0109.1
MQQCTQSLSKYNRNHKSPYTENQTPARLIDSRSALRDPDSAPQLTVRRAHLTMAAPSRAFMSGCSRRSTVARAQPQSQGQAAASRRAALLATASLPFVLQENAAVASTEVGSYLPSAGVDDFVLFVPDKAKTPAIRAGTVDRANPYRFAIPPSWSEKKVANIASGNYCQPRCAEPWTEVIFASDAEGKAQVLVSPLVRLTNKKDAKIEDIGTPEAFLASVGPFITGTYLDLEDVVDMSSKQLDDGLTYYYYDVYATYGTIGPHTLTACTVKGDLALLFCVSANDKQYARSKSKLNKMLQTFRA